MAQWGTKDQANNSPLWGVQQYNKPANTTTRAALYGNTTANGFVTGATIGVYAIDKTEMGLQHTGANTEAGKVAHTGWSVRRVGSGGRAGRVMYETLVAGGVTTTANTDDAIFPDTGA